MVTKKILQTAIKTPDIRKRIYVVLAVVVIYSLLSHIPIPLTEPVILRNFLKTLLNNNDILGFANILSGGALSQFSITLMGLMPYINASIILQLLTPVIPALENLSNEGESGRNKISYYTRLLTLPLAIGQSFAMITFLRQIALSQGLDILEGATSTDWILMVSTITAGSMLLMWLGEIVTEKGVGNGISIIILAGIVAGLPSQLSSSFSLTQSDSSQVLTMIFLGIIAIGVTAFTVLINEGVRNVPIAYARSVSSIGGYTGIDNNLPIRLIIAGVMPIIFALSFISMPQILGNILINADAAWVQSIANFMLTYFGNTSSWVYILFYFSLVIAFTFFYSSIVFKPEQIAENLQKQGGFIPGVRPGDETSSYLKSLISKTNLIGSVALGSVAVLPFILSNTLNISENLSVGGTSLLIMVSVIIETYRQIEAKALVANYDKY